MSESTKYPHILVKIIRSYLLPLSAIFAIEGLVAIEEWWMPNFTWSLWFGVALVFGNLLSYCLVGWISIRYRSGRLSRAVIAAMIILSIEATIRSAWVVLHPNTVVADSLLIVFQPIFDVTNGFSDTQLIVLGVFLQYIIFSPVYILASLAGGVVARMVVKGA